MANFSYEASCKDKNKYRNKKFAAQMAAKARKDTGEQITYYKCRFCRFYHIGHEPYQQIKAAFWQSPRLAEG